MENCAIFFRNAVKLRQRLVLLIRSRSWWFVAVGLCLFVVQCCVFYRVGVSSFTGPDGNQQHQYLVHSSSCTIPDLDPFADDVMQLVHRPDNPPCSELMPLSFVESSAASAAEEVLLLRINHTLLPQYNANIEAPIDRCCYQRIDRGGRNATADFEFRLGNCEPLPIRDSNESAVALPPEAEFVLVCCTANKGTNETRTVYTNAHALVRRRPAIQQRLEAMAVKRQALGIDRPLSVLMLGIDSVSRLNLQRTMPLTARNVLDNGWFELQGYNKIDDNTFPNLMAILVGYNESLIEERCEPTKVGGLDLDTCPFVWSDLRRAGYVTGYGEDEVYINTFAFARKGFQRPPTDYYMRPYMLAAERNLPVKKRDSLAFCLGDRHSVDHVYQYAVDFAAAYAGEPFFGIFWTNTFSHYSLSLPAVMDDRIRDYLLQLERRGVLNDSAVVFFSDHGLRFGAVRRLHTGWLEERLPFMFIWLPEWFRRARPDAVRALQSNHNRLTSPYDLHATLKHVLRMATTATAATLRPSGSDRVDGDAAVADAVSCPGCRSLFTPMPENRSCAQAAIAQHWCTCTVYEEESIDDMIIQDAVRFVLADINAELRAFTNTMQRLQCAELELHAVSFSRRAVQTNESTEQATYLVVFETTPGFAWFEATVLHDSRLMAFRLGGSVSRLNAYGEQSRCMPNARLKRYCYCM